MNPSEIVFFDKNMRKNIVSFINPNWLNPFIKRVGTLLRYSKTEEGKKFLNDPDYKFHSVNEIYQFINTIGYNPFETIDVPLCIQYLTDAIGYQSPRKIPNLSVMDLLEIGDRMSHVFQQYRKYRKYFNVIMWKYPFGNVINTIERTTDENVILSLVRHVTDLYVYTLNQHRASCVICSKSMRLRMKCRGLQEIMDENDVDILENVMYNYQRNTTCIDCGDDLCSDCEDYDFEFSQLEQYKKSLKRFYDSNSWSSIANEYDEY
jgi:hypothetical protein